MSKVFEGSSQFTDTRNVSVETLYGDARLLIKGVDADGKEIRAGIALDRNDVPAIALAILEAAGYTEDDRKVSNPLYATEFASAMIKLADGIELQERATAEAEAQAKLEAEALMLANSAVLAVGNPPYPSIEHMSDTSLRKWLAVARRAREINKEEK